MAYCNELMFLEDRLGLQAAPDTRAPPVQAVAGEGGRQQFLKAANGRRFRVVYPGRPGTTAGPDFRDAVLEEEGVGLVRGDVEVHVRQ